MSTADAAGPAVVVHEPFRRGVPPLRPYLRQLWQRREFVVHMARSKLKAQHYNTAFGQLWNVISPLLLAGVYFLLLGMIRGGERGTAEFMSTLIAGLFFFHYMRESVQAGADSVIAGERLVLNAAFPRAMLPLAAVVAAFLRFVPTMPLYVVLHVILRQPLTMTMILLPLLAAVLTLFNVGVGMFLSAVTVYVRDTKGFLPYVLRIWLYLTPILWSPSEVPGGLGALLKLNPLYFLFAALRRVVSGEWPTMAQLLASTASAVVVAIAGGLFFLSRERDLAVHL